MGRAEEEEASGGRSAAAGGRRRRWRSPLHAPSTAAAASESSVRLAFPSRPALPPFCAAAAVNCQYATECTPAKLLEEDGERQTFQGRDPTLWAHPGSGRLVLPGVDGRKINPSHSATF